MPAAKPNWAAVRPRSLARPLGPAKEMAVRSRKLMKNIRAMKGTRRIDTFRMVEFSTGDTAAAAIASPPGGRVCIRSGADVLPVGDSSSSRRLGFTAAARGCLHAVVLLLDGNLVLASLRNKRLIGRHL